MRGPQQTQARTASAVAAAADTETAPFEVTAGEIEQVLVEMRLTFVRESVDVIVPANSPTESMQPVAVSDLLTGAKMDIQPLAGDDFQSLLTVLPSIIRGPEGRLRIKGGTPTTGALQVSSASLNDPSSGDFDLELPSGAVESVEVLSNPLAGVSSSSQPIFTAMDRMCDSRISARPQTWLSSFRLSPPPPAMSTVRT